MAWLTGWKYRKSITLSRTSGAITNYPMKLLLGESSGSTGESVDCGGLCLSNFNDIRFTNSDGYTLLNYWIESISGTTPNQLATIWIKFDSIGTTNTTFYMYYGKSDATSVSNNSNMFIFYDDFERGNNGDAVGGLWRGDNTVATISTDHAFIGNRSAKLASNSTDWSININIPFTTNSDGYAVSIKFWKENAASFDLWIENNPKAIQVGCKATEDIYVSSVLDSTKNCLADQWDEIEVKNIRWSSSKYDLYYTGGQLAKSDCATVSDTGVDIIALYDRASGAGNETYFDNIIIRNYVSPEPSWGTWSPMDSEWLSGWKYRKSITLSRASGAVNNYQMKLLVGETSGAAGENVDCAGLCLSNFNDIRFTNSNGTTLLDYWIESITGVSPNQLATIWIEFDTIGVDATTFYMYYGNSSATSLSNGINTFPLFDNFDGGGLNNSIWSVAGSPSLSSSILSFGAVSNCGIASKTAYPPGYAVRAKGSWSQTGSKYPLFRFTENSSGDATNSNNELSIQSYSQGYIQSRKDGTWGTQLDFGTSYTGNRIWEISRTDSNNAIITVDGAVLQNRTSSIPTSNLFVNIGQNTDAYTTCDWILVRTQLPVEPSWGTWSTTLEYIDSYTKLLIHGNRNLGIVDSATGKTITVTGGAAISSGKTITTNGNASITSGRLVTAYGNAQLSTLQSKFGGASGLFDGTDDRISVPASSDFDFGTGDFTIDFWVYFTSTAGYQYLFDIGNDNSILYYYSGNWYIKNPVATTILSWSNTPTLNTWIHVAIGRNGTNWFLFTDGVLRTIATSSLTYGISNLAFTVGGWGSGSSYGFKGYMDEFRVSKGILRWTTDFNVPTVPYESDPYTKLLLHFNDTTTFYDHSLCRPYFGDVGYFDGTNSYLTLADSDDWNFGTGDFTIDFWMNIRNQPAVDTQDFIFSQYTDSSNRYYLSLGNYSGTNILRFNHSSDIDILWITLPSYLNTLTWYHITLVRYNGNTRIYVNGTMVGTTSTSYTISNYSGTFRIGTRNADWYFDGYMDEFRVSKGIARWTSNFTPPTVPYESDSYTKLLIHFNNVSGATTFYDYSISRPYFNESIYFDGSTGYLTTPDSSDWDFGTDLFTIDWWFNTTNATTWRGLLGQYDAGGRGTYELYVGDANNSNRVSINMWYNSWADYSLSGGYTINVWNHAAIVRDSATFIKLYINGSLVDTEVIPSDLPINNTSSIPLYIGKTYRNATSNCYQGYLDELRISKGIARWTNNFTPPIAEYFITTILSTPTSKRPLCAYSGGVRELAIGDAIVIPGEYQLTYASTIGIDFTTYDVQSIVLTGNTIFTLNNLTNGRHYVLVVTQDAAGGRTASFVNTIRWFQGITPTLSVASGITDIFTFVKSRDILYGSCTKAFQAEN